MIPRAAWRAFPWDAAAPLGEPFSASFIRPGQTSGRFDLHDRPPVLYLAESPDQAIGEMLQGFRGRRIGPAHLVREGHPLALAAVELDARLAGRVLDLTEPMTLARVELKPDALASHQRVVTQGVARRLHAAGEVGFRWWSALTGAWHTIVLFSDRFEPADLHWGDALPLALDSPELLGAAKTPGDRSGVKPFARLGCELVRGWTPTTSL